MKRNDIVETASKVIGSITGILVHLGILIIFNTLSF